MNINKETGKKKKNNPKRLFLPNPEISRSVYPPVLSIQVGRLIGSLRPG